MKTKISDGGFRSSRISDSNNCTVTGLANALGIPYELADQLCAQAGRKRRKGFHMEEIVTYIHRLGLRFRRLPYKKQKLSEFCLKHSKGRYYVGNVNHAFAIVDGTPVNAYPVSNVTLLDVWKVV